MDFLTTGMFENASGLKGRSLFRSGIYWCYRAGDGRDWKTRIAENPRLKKLTEAHQVHFVPIGDFDLWMMELGEACDVGDPEQILRGNTEHRVKTLADQLSKARAEQAAPAPDSALEESRAETRGDIGKKLTEWDLVYKARTEKDPAKAEELYAQAVKLAPANTAILGNYALFLTDIRKEHDRAQEYYERALKADPNNAAILGNYAGSQLAQGKREVGLAILTRARAGLATDSTPDLDVEVGFYAYAHRPAPERDVALAHLKQLLIEKGARSESWDFSLNIQRARQDDHPEAAWLPKLAEVINAKAPPSSLDAWPAWQNAS